MKTLLWLLTVGTLGLALSSPAHADDIDDILNDMDTSQETLAEPPTGNALFEAPSSDLTSYTEDGFSKAPTAPVKKSAKNKSTQAAAPIAKLDDHVDSLALETEFTDVDNEAYEDLASQRSVEATTLQQEVKTLEKELKGLKVESERVKKRALLAHKRLELQKQLQRDAKTRLAKAERQKRQQDQKLAKLRNRVKHLEESAAQAQAKNEKTKVAIRAAQKEQAQLERRLRQASQKMAAAKRKKRNLSEMKARIEHQNRYLKSQVSKAERRTGSDS